MKYIVCCRNSEQYNCPLIYQNNKILFLPTLLIIHYFLKLSKWSNALGFLEMVPILLTQTKTSKSILGRSFCHCLWELRDSTFFGSRMVHNRSDWHLQAKDERDGGNHFQVNYVSLAFFSNPRWRINSLIN